MQRRHTQNLAPLLPPQLGADHAADSGTNGLARLVDEYAGIVVKLHYGPILPLYGVPGADDDGVSDITSLDLVGGGRGGHTLTGGGALLLDDADDTVAYGGMPLLANDLGALDEGSAGVVDAVKDCLGGARIC